MKTDLANFSADLRRISYWIYDGRIDLAQKFIDKCKSLYKNINPKISCYKNIWSEIEKIKNLEGGKLKAAERASTASIIVFHKSQKIN